MKRLLHTNTQWLIIFSMVPKTGCLLKFATLLIYPQYNRSTILKGFACASMVNGYYAQGCSENYIACLGGNAVEAGFIFISQFHSFLVFEIISQYIVNNINS